MANMIQCRWHGSALMAREEPDPFHQTSDIRRSFPQSHPPRGHLPGGSDAKTCIVPSTTAAARCAPNQGVSRGVQ